MLSLNTHRNINNRSYANTINFGAKKEIIDYFFNEKVVKQIKDVSSLEKWQTFINKTLPSGEIKNYAEYNQILKKQKDECLTSLRLILSTCDKRKNIPIEALTERKNLSDFINTTDDLWNDIRNGTKVNYEKSHETFRKSRKLFDNCDYGEKNQSLHALCSIIRQLNYKRYISFANPQKTATYIERIKQNPNDNNLCEFLTCELHNNRLE